MFDWFKKKKPEAQTQPEEVVSAPVPQDQGEAEAPIPAPPAGEREGEVEQAEEPVHPLPSQASPGPLPLPQGEREGSAPIPGTGQAPIPSPPAGEGGAHRDSDGRVRGESSLTSLSPTLPEDEDRPEKKSWFARLKDGLSKSTSRLTDGITGIFTKKKLDDEALEELEELLIRADLGPVTAAKLAAGLAKTRFGKEVSPQEVREYLADEVAKLVAPVAKPLTIDAGRKPHVILVVGVNGTGKTTTIGKLARQLTSEGKTVWLAAGDTFRAAAVSQLKIWGERTGCPVVAKDTGADAAGLAYEALERARAAGADVLLIDTAGRLQNKAGLMEELRKIVRVLKKLEPDAPHTTLLTLDATTGQNAHSQVEVFRDMVQINGLILTKLDGSARGGVLVALATKFGIPVHAIGVGEGVYDMRPFEAKAFARALVGLE